MKRGSSFRGLRFGGNSHNAKKNGSVPPENSNMSNSTINRRRAVETAKKDGKYVSVEEADVKTVKRNVSAEGKMTSHSQRTPLFKSFEAFGQKIQSHFRRKSVDNGGGAAEKKKVQDSVQRVSTLPRGSKPVAANGVENTVRHRKISDGVLVQRPSRSSDMCAGGTRRKSVPACPSTLKNGRFPPSSCQDMQNGGQRNSLQPSNVSVKVQSCSNNSERDSHSVNTGSVQVQIKTPNLAVDSTKNGSPASNDVSTNSASVSRKNSQRTPQQTSSATLPRPRLRPALPGAIQERPCHTLERREGPRASGRQRESAVRVSRRNESEAPAPPPAPPPRPKHMMTRSTRRKTSNCAATQGLRRSLSLNLKDMKENKDDDDSDSPPGTPRYHEVKDFLDPKNWSISQELLDLSKFGWYWGPLTREEAEEKLADLDNGAFLVRDSSSDLHLLSLTFRSQDLTLHTRIEHCNGMFSLFSQPDHDRSRSMHESVVALIEDSVRISLNGIFCYSKPRTPNIPSFPVRLTEPVSRFRQVRSLQSMCRFVIRLHIRLDHVQKLPLPRAVKGWLEENHWHE